MPLGPYRTGEDMRHEVTLEFTAEEIGAIVRDARNAELGEFDSDDLEGVRVVNHMDPNDDEKWLLEGGEVLTVTFRREVDL